MLRELQGQFLAAVFDRDEQLLPQLRATGRLSPQEQIAVYRGSVHGILCKALCEVYPVCLRLVGDEYFDALCLRYIAGHRPSHHNLEWFGGELPAFLDGFEPIASIPYLPDVARLEWAWHRAFHAADEAGLDPAALAAVPPEQQPRLRFRLPAGAALITSPYPVDEIWQVNRPDWSGGDAVSLDGGGVQLMVWRRGLEMRIERIADDHWPLLSLISAGSSLAELAADTSVSGLDRLLPEAFQQGWIAGFELDPNNQTEDPT